MLHKLAIYALLTALAGSMLFPFYWMLATSFKNRKDVFATEPRMIPGRSLMNAPDARPRGSQVVF